MTSRERSILIAVTCIVCREQQASAGLLCTRCAADLCGTTALCPEQVVSIGTREAHGLLVDQWGRAHAVADAAVVGRQPGVGGVVVAEPSVSRRHATVRRGKGGAWILVDLESSNGTFVNKKRVIEAALESGDMVTLGDVSFFFSAEDERAGREGAPRPLETARPPKIYESDGDEDRDETFAGLRFVPVKLAAPTGGGGGVLEVDGMSVQLTLVQFELVRLLVERIVAESDRDERVRGFVRSSELAATLPWDTARPDDNNLKQLVRRLRRTLQRAGIADIVESRHGFGYRLRIMPARMP